MAQVGCSKGMEMLRWCPCCLPVQMQSLCSLPIVRYQEPQEEDGLEDMTQLE